MSNFLRWMKGKKYWTIVNWEGFKKEDKDLFKCPLCKSDNLKWDMDFNEEQKRFIDHDWRCLNCAENIRFNQLSEKTQKFIKNLVLRDLNGLYNNPVRMIVKFKKGKEVNLSKIGFRIDTESATFICGSCKKKNNFKVLDKEKHIFQCLNCGLYNLLME